MMVKVILGAITIGFPGAPNERFLSSLCWIPRGDGYHLRDYDTNNKVKFHPEVCAN